MGFELHKVKNIWTHNNRLHTKDRATIPFCPAGRIRLDKRAPVSQPYLPIHRGEKLGVVGGKLHLLLELLIQFFKEFVHNP